MCIICADMSAQFRRTEFLPEDMAMDRGVGGQRAWSDAPFGFLDLDERGGFGPNGKASLLPGDAGTQITRSNLSWATGLGQAATVTYSFRSNAPATMPSDTSGFSRFSATQIAATELMLQAWSDVAQITFQRNGTGSSGEAAYSDNASMVFGNYSAGSSGSAAFAYLPGNAATGANSGDVWVNSSLAYNSAPAYLAYGYQVLVHEIGHAIGLSHPADYNAGSGGTITYGESAIYYEDSRQYTVMSYFAEGNTGAAFVGRYASAPLLDDIAAAQRLYGANMTTRTGDTVYGFNSNAGRIWYDATQGGANQAVIFAVWDAGGVDTLDFSGYSQSGLIDLRQGHFSSVGGLTGNVSIAMGAVIENATGGSGNDTLIGNSGGNLLRGNGGNDTIDGGAGTDTAVYSGPQSQYTVTAGIETVNGVAYRIVTIGGPDGTDVLRNIEFITFSDGTITAPTVAAGIILEGDQTAETINGTDYADWLYGGGGDDTINGGMGNDRINGGAGNDSLNGGLGFDTVDYSSSTFGVTVNLSTGIATGGGGSDTVSNFEGITGSRFADTLTGNASGEVIDGGGGADIMNGEGGADTLIAGVGTLTAAADVIKASTQSNQSIAAAVNIDGNFDLLNDPGVTNATTIPHAVIRGTATGGGREYYAFTVSAGAACVFDIAAASFDTTLRIFDASGVELVFNDDDPAGGTASLINYTFATAGTYYVAVGAWTQAATVNGVPPANGQYVLNVSIPGHTYVESYNAGSTMNGGDGDDLMHSGTGDDTFNGGNGTDTAVFVGQRSLYTITDLGGGSYRVTGPDGTGTDTLNGVERIQFSDQVVALAGPAVNEVNGTGNPETLDGTEGTDIIRGFAGNDVLNGLGADDLLYGGDGGDALNGGAGTDTAWYENGVVGGQLVIDLAAPSNNTGEAAGDTYSSIERVVGSTGADIIRGTAASEIFQGRGGDDIFLGRGGGDWFDGGDGVDTVWYDGQAVIDLRDWATNSGAAAGDRYDSIERVVASDLNDIIRGSNGAEVFQGRGGDDIFQGRGGGDWFDGGTGLDTVWYDEAVVADLRDWATNSGGAAGDRYDSIERVVGSNFNDIIRGTVGGDFFTGRGGDDIFQGRSGGDWFDGGDGVDTVWYDEVATVDLLVWQTNAGAAAGDRYDGIERVVSSNSDDVLRGTDGVDYFVGRGGNDIMEGRGGADWFDGGDGIDTVWYSQGMGPGVFLVVDMIDYQRSTGQAAGDRFFNVERVVSSNESDYILGTQNQDFILTRDGDDAVEGRGGNDVIDTGAGNDRIHGGLGGDSMTGGSGADAFVYLGASEGGDFIADFAVGQDKIELYAPGFSVNTLPSNWFVAGSAATAANAQLIWDAANRTLSFDADGTGSGAAVVLATLGGSANLTQSDIAWTGLASAIGKLDAAWVSPLAEDDFSVSGKSLEPLVLPAGSVDALTQPLVLPALADEVLKSPSDTPLINFDWEGMGGSKMGGPLVLPGADIASPWDDALVLPLTVGPTPDLVDLDPAASIGRQSYGVWTTDGDHTAPAIDGWLMFS